MVTLAKKLIDDVQCVGGILERELPDVDNWFWSKSDPMASTFVLPNKTAYLLLPTSIAWEIANKRWLRSNSEETWTLRWKKLWGSDLTRCAKTFLWRITMHGLYMLDKAHRLGHGDGFYMACSGTMKMPEHIFFDCFKAQRGWVGNVLLFEPDPYASYLIGKNSFINILDSALEKTSMGTAQLYVVYQTAWTL